MQMYLLVLIFTVTAEWIKCDEEGWDWIFGAFSNYTVIENTSVDKDGFAVSYSYVNEILDKKHGNATYAAVMLHECSSLCKHVNSTIPVNWYIFGMSSMLVKIWYNSIFCYTLGECLDYACNMPFEVASFWIQQVEANG